MDLFIDSIAMGFGIGLGIIVSCGLIITILGILALIFLRDEDQLQRRDGEV